VPDIVEFREVLPKSLTGKVLKKELSEAFSDARLIERSEDAAGRIGPESRVEESPGSGAPV
jgi:hypothetical protein